MFTIQQDYIIKNTDIPVLTRQADGHFEPTNCYFLEFMVRPDDKAMDKIKALCKPFGFDTGVRYAISKHGSLPDNVQRIFLLGGPEIIKTEFTNPNDFLAITLCDDGPENTEIQYFEVNYIFRHSYDPNKQYRRVGTSALKALQKNYQTRELWGESAMEALNFWLKNDFTRINNQDFRIRWHQK